MAVNPMQRKANNSFLLGILVTLLITGLIIGFLILQLSKLNKEIQDMKDTRVTAYVLKENVLSGEIVTTGMLKRLEIDSQIIPSNAISATEDLDNYSLCDKDGNEIISYKENNVRQYAIQLPNNESHTKLTSDVTTGKYYYEINESNGTKSRIYVEFEQEPIVAKVDLNANTLLTTGVIKRGELITDDVRTQEYNIISLPSQLQTGECVDVRLRLATGEDYIVISHKEVTIPAIDGVDSLDCVWLDMTELETLTMSSAIIEAYKAQGAKLYATRYVEAGLQDPATTTYIPSDATIALIESDSNVLTAAKNALYSRMNSRINNLDNTVKNIVRNPINSAIDNNSAQDSLESGVQSEIQGLQEERERYLQSIGA